MKKRDRIFKNHACWCESGRTYGNCHKNRHQEERLPFQQMKAKILEFRRLKLCLHPNAGLNCGKIIRAHTIQKNGPLSEIAMEGHVYTFDPFEQDDTLQKTGLNRASTFTGYCGEHDSDFFKPIENGNLFEGTVEQILLSGYRAYSMEYFKKVASARVFDFYRDFGDRGVGEIEQREYQSYIKTLRDGTKSGEIKMRNTLDKYEFFLTQSHPKISSLSIHLEGTLTIAVCGAFAPCFDINRTKIRSEVYANNISINTMLTQTGIAIVFSWPTEYADCARFAGALAQHDQSKLPDVLVSIIFSYIENTYFSKTWYEELTHYQQSIIRGFFKQFNMYNRCVDIFDCGFTDWRITNIVEGHEKFVQI